LEGNRFAPEHLQKVVLFRVRNVNLKYVLRALASKKTDPTPKTLSPIIGAMGA